MSINFDTVYPDPINLKQNVLTIFGIVLAWAKLTKSLPQLDRSKLFKLYRPNFPFTIFNYQTNWAVA